MLHVEDWAEIRRLHFAEGLPIKQIARQLGISKNTVKAKLAADAPPRYQRAPVGSVVDEVEPRIRELLQGCPTMPATVIAERIGWRRGMTVLSARVRELRPVYLPPDPSSRTAYVAGEVAQNDFWFPDITLPVEFGHTRTAKQLPVLTMVSAYSRMLFALLIPNRHGEDLYAGWWRGLARLGAVPRVLVWDGEGAVGEYAGGRNKATGECQGFRGLLGAKVLVLRPRDPEAKGIIERAHDYLERAFLPGRTFTSPADFNAQPDQPPTRHRPRPARLRVDDWAPVRDPVALLAAVTSNLHRAGQLAHHLGGALDSAQQAMAHIAVTATQQPDEKPEMTEQGVSFRPQPGGQPSAAVDIG